MPINQLAILSCTELMKDSKPTGDGYKVELYLRYKEIEKGSRYECQTCKKNFISEELINKHLTNKHPLNLTELCADNELAENIGEA